MILLKEDDMTTSHIPKPARTKAAEINFRPTSATDTIDQDGNIRHDFAAYLHETNVIDTAIEVFSLDGDQVAIVRADNAGRFGTIAKVTVIEKPDGTMIANGWIQGGDNGGRRYIHHYGPDALFEAKQHVKKWANRRFRVAAE